ncbi:MAG: protein translocase subunit SecF, partial [Alphaproteobacteria bacterium]
QGDESAQLAAVAAAKTALGESVSYRRTEFVGPKVGGELIEAGIMAVLLAMGAMLVYIWFRFEWQFAIAGVAALVHDVIITIGLFAITGWEFNLSTIAALLTIAGYSINDTVVVFDRVRENLRRYKPEALDSLNNRSLNETLARTVLTGGTTVIALGALAIFGGEVIRSYTLAMIWGILVGTYSSIFVSACLLLHMRDIRQTRPEPATPGTDLAEAEGEGG